MWLTMLLTNKVSTSFYTRPIGMNPSCSLLYLRLSISLCSLRRTCRVQRVRLGLHLISPESVLVPPPAELVHRTIFSSNVVQYKHTTQVVHDESFDC
jgi:hypothetical protein